MPRRKIISNLNLIKNFSALWDFKIDNVEKIPQEELVGYMDPAKVMMIIPKLKHIKEMIKQNFDVEEGKPPAMNFAIQFIEGSADKIKVFGRLEGVESKYDENSVRLTRDYLKVILKLATNTLSESVLFKFRKDYPLWVETDEMIIIVAPRVSEI